MILREFIFTTMRKYLNEQFDHNTLYYHGSHSKIEKFQKMPPINLRGNVDGFYFTNNLNVAKAYGKEVTSVKLKVKNPFINGKSEVSEEMINQYKKELHNENPYLPLDGDWIESKCQYFKNYKQMSYTGLDGYAQQVIFKVGGYDSFIDGHEIAVFNSDDIIILNQISYNVDDEKMFTMRQNLNKQQ